MRRAAVACRQAPAPPSSSTKWLSASSAASCKMVWFWLQLLHVWTWFGWNEAHSTPSRVSFREQLGERFEHRVSSLRVELTEAFHEPGFIHRAKLIEHHLP